MFQLFPFDSILKSECLESHCNITEVKVVIYSSSCHSDPVLSNSSVIHRYLTLSECPSCSFTYTECGWLIQPSPKTDKKRDIHGLFFITKKATANDLYSAFSPFQFIIQFNWSLANTSSFLDERIIWMCYESRSMFLQLQRFGHVWSVALGFSSEKSINTKVQTFSDAQVTKQCSWLTSRG